MKRLLSLLLLACPLFASYSGYRQFTVDHTKVGASDSSNFTVLISGTWAEFATVANSGKVQNTVSCGVNSITCPADLVFTSDATCATTTYSWEPEQYTAASGQMIVWVKVGTLSHTADTLIYACVGNAAVNTFQGGARGAAWDANFFAVYHLPDGSTLSPKDSTSNARDLTNSGTTAAAGFIDGGVTSTVGNSLSKSTLSLAFPLSTSVWMKPSAVGSFRSAVSLSTGGVAKIKPIEISPFGGNTFPEVTFGGVADYQFTSLQALSVGVWYYFTSTISGNGGAAIGYGSPAGGSLGSQTITVGTASGSPWDVLGIAAGDSWAGSLDEVRISTVVRSADWITAEYNNQNSPSTFYSVSAFVPLGFVANQSVIAIQ